MSEQEPGQASRAAEVLLIEDARKALYQLVGAAETGTVTLIARGSRTAVLAPLVRLGEQHVAALPSLPVTEARKKLGELVDAAAGGEPQVLRRRRTPVAVLLPATAIETDHSTPAPAAASPAASGRALATLSDVMGDFLGPDTTVGVSFGLDGLDAATGGLLPGRLVLIAAAPGAGGSLLAAAAARQVALEDGKPVLYAASGLTRADVAARVIAAEAGADYRRLRAGALTASEHVAVAEATARLSQAALHIDDGGDLTAEAIAATAPDVEHLALIVVDRLQHLHDPQVPLSGPVLPAAARTLAHLARTQQVPVLAAVDTDDPNVIGTLNADVTLTLVRSDQVAEVTIAERDFGQVATIMLRADLAHARFADPGEQPPSSTTTTAAHTPAPAPPLPGNPPAEPDEPPAASTPPARPPRRNTAERPDLVSFIPDRVASALESHGGDRDAALVYLAGEPNKAGQSIEDVMELWDATRVGGRYEPTAYPELPDPLIRKRRGNADEVWEARPKYTNPAKELIRQTVTPLDVNGAYLSALGAAALPVRSITHNPVVTDPKGREWSWENPDAYGRGVNLAGIVLIDQPKWPHAHLPHPLGDDRETAGRLWVPTSVYAKLKDAKNAGLLEELPRIREAYVAKGTDNLFKILVGILRDARSRAIADGDALTKTYVAKMYAVLVSTIGDSGANHHIKRPDWEHIIRGHAFANLWRKAIRAHRAGLIVAYAGGTDELHLAGGVEDVFGTRLDGKPVFVQGTSLNEIKVKGEPYEWSGRAVRN
ncbi:type II toxin-antitoxin system prevent-host-death family antitoxin [Streptomyces sp. RB6PN25]|uniref:Type II toxin-antitoxin system prevent-host-death family antitoxin n=1 Tax=Streptomyces humicola TaxID=2953240 RepID=A0ABT1PPX8_9ACTN|nr:type II toxin-antitoxin system prevent-host-death family antitoxin [Streptomyces humicola]MCQ4079743.1 type II toxin-antitoxin system prevent-host-death family antitoxin [Streptomyces humicola]